MTEKMKPKFADTNTQFDTGAKRGDASNKPRPDLISPYAQERIGMVNAHGAKNYGDRNWEKGMPFSRVLASLERHVMDYKKGRRDEDHMAQAAWNAMAMIHFEEMISLGILPGTLDDMPKYEGKKVPPKLCECTIIDPCPNGKVGFDVRCVTDSDGKAIPTPGSMVGFSADSIVIDEMVLEPEQPGIDITTLIALGCKPEVAKHVIAGTTYVPGMPGTCPVGYVYVAGPMRGYEKFNFPAFDAARDQLLQNGWNVISPADIDRHSDCNEDTPPEQVTDQRRFVLRDFYALFFLAHVMNGRGAIAMLPNWEKSTGAVAEFFLARWLGLRVLDAETGCNLNFNKINRVNLIASIAAFLDGQLEK